MESTKGATLVGAAPMNPVGPNLVQSCPWHAWVGSRRVDGAERALQVGAYVEPEGPFGLQCHAVGRRGLKLGVILAQT